MKQIAPPFDAARRIDVLREIEPSVEARMAAHVDKRRLWYPAELLPEGKESSELAERADSLSVGLRACLALNLLTEEGLPHFHRLLSEAFGHESPWSRWNFVWTAEEDRHGCVLRDYGRDAKIFRQASLEALQHQYVEAGFSPVWGSDPFKALVYVTVQERATWLSHRNVAQHARGVEPILTNILTRISAEEGRHFLFYREVFRDVIEADPEGALEAALFVLPAIDMPGAGMPGFRDLAEFARREGVYGPRDYTAIVTEVIDSWDIESLSGLSPDAERNRDAILRLPQRLERVSSYAERRATREPSVPAFLQTPEDSAVHAVV